MENITEDVKQNPTLEERRSIVEQPEESVLQNRTRFFIDELANAREIEARHYQSLSRRIDGLERKNKGSFDEDDPTRMIGGIILAMVALQMITPLIEMWVVKWRSAQS